MRPRVADPALPGRAAETRALAGLLDRLDGDGRAVLVVAGDAGPGKTAPLRWTAEAARGAGVTVLRATGVEFERDLAFAGLIAALRPLLPRIDDMAPGQAIALRGALGLAPTGAAELSVYGATLSLLSLGADATPVLVVVDDAQWLDTASLEALVFAAHRAEADRVGFLFAQRSAHVTALDHARFPGIRLGGLDRAAAVAVLRAEGVDDGVAARCWELTDGNPLALLEGARGLSPAQRRGEAALPAALPVEDRLLDGYRHQLSALPAPARRALGVAALTADGDEAVIAAALASLGGARPDLDGAVLAGVVAVGHGRAR